MCAVGLRSQAPLAGRLAPLAGRRELRGSRPGFAGRPLTRPLPQHFLCKAHGCPRTQLASGNIPSSGDPDRHGLHRCRKSSGRSLRVFAWVTNSVADITGTEGCTTRVSEKLATIEIGVKSLTGSKASLGYNDGLTVSGVSRTNNRV